MLLAKGRIPFWVMAVMMRDDYVIPWETRVSKECQWFHDFVAGVARESRKRRWERYCPECGFLRPGHSDDCKNIYRPAVIARVWGMAEEPSIEQQNQQRQTDKTNTIGDQDGQERQCDCVMCQMSRQMMSLQGDFGVLARGMQEALGIMAGIRNDLLQNMVREMMVPASLLGLPPRTPSPSSVLASLPESMLMIGAYRTDSRLDGDRLPRDTG